MKFKIDKMLLITTVVCLFPIVLSLVLYSKLPDQIAIHWNIAGNPDDYASKPFAAFGIPLLMAVVNFVVHVALNSDPKRENSSVVLKQISKWIAPVLSMLLVPITLFIAMGYDIPVNRVVPIFVSLIIILLGNYLPKCKQNYTVGIKLPWTLNNEANWNKTHHLAGYLWTFGGLCLLLSSFFNINNLAVTIVILTILVVIPTIYSYLLYKNGL